jgi:uncharacterized protein YkwD
MQDSGCSVWKMFAWLVLTGLTAGPASAQDPARLANLINAYRTEQQTCAGKRTDSLPPLAPNAALAGVQTASGQELPNALKKAGYRAARAELITVSGAEDPQSVMALLRAHYCRSLLSRRYSEVGISRTAATWQIVLAQPLLADDLGDSREAGKGVLRLVNRARAEPRTCGDQHFAAAPPLVWNAKLAQAALAHSRDMAQRNYFRHAGKDGSEVGDRAKRQGYEWQQIGENIATGQGSAAQAVAGWLASPGHCANIMNPDFTESGAAYAVNTGSDTVIYWTQVFGTPR